MTPLLTSARMRAAEAAAMDSGAVTGAELMARAGAAVVAAALTQWPDPGRGRHRALVLCGPGNNGGDGFVIARLLAARDWMVEVHFLGHADRLPRDARAAHDAWRADGGAVIALDDPRQGLGGFGPDMATGDDAPALVVDALFGAGLTRPLPEKLAQVLTGIRIWSERLRIRPRIVAVDVPSGLCADSGRVLGGGPEATLPAGLTVTFHRAKPGHYLARGPGLCGRLVVADIGLPDSAPDPGDPRLIGAEAARDLSRGKAMAAGHKFDHGHALILSGGAGRTGAARLAARAALRIGAGLVTLGVPGAAQHECAMQVTAIMLARVEDGAGLARVLEDARLTALCLGPGLGLTEDRAGLLAAALHSQRPCVLDADALTLIARDASLAAALHPACVLTPHGGEFARLFPDLAERLAAPPTTGPAFSKVDAARAAAARVGCTVLFKGADTVIAAPGGICEVHSAAYDRAAPWLATAGAGDVLAGMIAGLLARGRRPEVAARTAAWLHVEAARAFGPGLIAEDLPEALPGAMRAAGVT